MLSGVSQKQRSRGVLRKRCPEDMQKIYRSAISIKLLYNFIEIVLRHGRSSVNLLHIFRTPFPKDISGGLRLAYLKASQRSTRDLFY